MIDPFFFFNNKRQPQQADVEQTYYADKIYEWSSQTFNGMFELSKSTLAIGKTHLFYHLGLFARLN